MIEPKFLGFGDEPPGGYVLPARQSALGFSSSGFFVVLLMSTRIKLIIYVPLCGILMCLMKLTVN